MGRAALEPPWPGGRAQISNRHITTRHQLSLSLSNSLTLFLFVRALALEWRDAKKKKSRGPKV